MIRPTVSSRRRATIAALAVGAFALVACSNEIDADRLEDSIREEAERAFEGYDIGAVECPEGIELEEGNVFDCEVEIADATVTVEVTQEDDEGNVTIEQAEAVLDVQLVVDIVAEDLSAQLGIPVSVDCGDDEVRAEEPGEVFECDATADDGSTATVEISVVDVDGNIEWQLL